MEVQRSVCDSFDMAECKTSVASTPKGTRTIHQRDELPEEPAKYCEVELPELASRMEMMRMEDNKGLVCPFASLSSLLQRVYEDLQPTEGHRVVRLDILARLANLVGYMDACKGATLLPFGSFESNLYTPWGDLDVSMVIPNESSAKSKKLKVLKAVRDALSRSGVFFNIQLVSHARVPLLMFVDGYSNVACDLSVNNTAAVIKSHVMGWVTRMDPRCRGLIFLVKCWAKAQGINDPKLGTLNSYALSLLVIFHLQTRDPPILPPLSAIFCDGMAVDDALKQCLLKIQTLTNQGFGRNNTSSVAELFLSFFVQFSAVADLWHDGLVVSTYAGKWRDKNTTERSWAGKGYVMLVEDPFDLTENCARSVHEASFKLICKAFSLTVDTLYNTSFYLYPSTLKERLFQWPSGSLMPLSSSRPGIPQLQEYVPSANSTGKAKAKKVETVAKATALRQKKNRAQGENGTITVNQTALRYNKDGAQGEKAQQLADKMSAMSLNQSGNQPGNQTRERTEREAVAESVRSLFRPPPRPLRREWRPKPQ